MTQPPLCYPHPAGHHLSRPPNTDLHDTAGLPGFWALDFMAPGGTPVLASQDGRVLRVSGHDPASGVHEGDIFGWNVYLITTGDVEYFDTHYGDVIVKPGQQVKRGDQLGTVGHWPGDPGRSHTHRGVKHPYGKVPSVSRIEAIAHAVMVTHGLPL